jgi:hypothetical protein
MKTRILSLTQRRKDAKSYEKLLILNEAIYLRLMMRCLATSRFASMPITNIKTTGKIKRNLWF